MTRIVARRIDTPAYAFELEIDVEPDQGEAAQQAFAAHLEQVLEHIGVMLETAFNDPDIFFLDESSGFPLRAEVTGEYYVSSLTYSGHVQSHDLWVLLHCLGKSGRESDSDSPDFDYVGMEMIVHLDKKTGEISFEENFTWEAI